MCLAPTTQNVELTVYLLLASDQESGSVAPELESVVKQLKTTFAFKGFELSIRSSLEAETSRG